MTLFTNQMVRELKGPALSVVVLLILNPGGVSQEFLERSSGYTDKPISQALAYLRETGRIVKTRAGWSLIAGLQLPLTYQECLPCGDNLDTIGQGRKNSDSTTTTKLSNEVINIDISSSNRSRKNSDSDKYGGKSEEEVMSIYQELAYGSVFRNDRVDELVAQDYITVEYVKGWRLHQKSIGRGGSNWAGLLIKILESGEPAPLLGETGHLIDCTCKECRPRVYREMSAWIPGEEGGQ